MQKSVTSSSCSFKRACYFYGARHPARGENIKELQMKQWIVSSVAAAFLLLASIVHAGQEPDAIRDADIPAANAKGLIYTKEGKTGRLQELSATRLLN